MIKLTTEIINSTTGLSSGTYVVEDTIELSQDLTIPEDVTLIFQGGKFETTDESELTISGSNTRLIAPICTIFGKGINVTGSWDIDRAYPQWFEIEKFINSCDSPIPYNDWSTPINNAIKMKQVGEVFLKNGDYGIAEPIIMSKGIKLLGENTQVLDNEGNGCTEIFPIAEGTNKFTEEYMLYVNSHNVSTNFQYIDRSTIICGIRFTDWHKKISSRKCIYAGGGVHFDKIVWKNFIQAVKYTETYNDGRSITNCIFETDTEPNITNKEYAFDTCFLGDALKFEHNGIANTANGKALRLSHCGGATIQGNIINGDILIKNSKAIVFDANHCEYGIQVEIIDSCVSFHNNFLEKGERPNIFIHNSDFGDKSVVSMNNDMFLMFNFLRGNYEDETLAKSALLDFRNHINNISECDIAIDKNTIINIENVYRYEIGTIGFAKMYPCGIRINKVEKNETEDENNNKIITFNHTESFEEFNNYSYIASCNSQIHSGFKFNIHDTIKENNKPNIYCSMQNNNVYWFIESGLYNYYYQIVWDRTRGIKKITSSTNSSTCTKKINWSGDQPTLTNEINLISSKDDTGIWIDKINYPKGVLLCLSEDTNGNCSMVRLIREKVTGDPNLNNLEFEAQEVYIPICGTQFLYDNGISVCGYKWSEPFTFTLQEACDKNMEMFRVIDGNVECFTKREGGITPTTGWKRGDVIHNIGNNPSTYIVPEDIV